MCTCGCEVCISKRSVVTPCRWHDCQSLYFKSFYDDPMQLKWLSRVCISNRSVVTPCNWHDGRSLYFKSFCGDPMQMTWRSEFVSEIIPWWPHAVDIGVCILNRSVMTPCSWHDGRRLYFTVYLIWSCSIFTKHGCFHTFTVTDETTLLLFILDFKSNS